MLFSYGLPHQNPERFICGPNKKEVGITPILDLVPLPYSCHALREITGADIGPCKG